MDAKKTEFLRVALREILQRNLAKFKEGENWDVVVDRIESQFFRVMAMARDQVE